MYRIEKTNKKTVTYHFETLDELYSHCENKDYTKGNAKLFHNNTLVVDAFYYNICIYVRNEKYPPRKVSK